MLKRKWTQVAGLVQEVTQRVDAARSPAEALPQESGSAVSAVSARSQRLEHLEADAACCAALAQRQEELVCELRQDERSACRLVCEHVEKQPVAEFSEEDDEGEKPHEQSVSASSSALDVCRVLQQQWDARARALPQLAQTEQLIADAAQRCLSCATSLTAEA